jgi:uncharacterized metal-binding protein YceD (DUF177 family)
MRVDIREIIGVPGASASFEFEPDLSDAASGSVNGIKRAKAAGRIQNSAGVLVLSADVDAVLDCTCARCLGGFERRVHMSVENTLSERPEEEENRTSTSSRETA